MWNPNKPPPPFPPQQFDLGGQYGNANQYQVQSDINPHQSQPQQQQFQMQNQMPVMQNQMIQPPQMQPFQPQQIQQVVPMYYPNPHPQQQMQNEMIQQTQIQPFQPQQIQQAVPTYYRAQQGQVNEIGHYGPQQGHQQVQMNNIGDCQFVGAHDRSALINEFIAFTPASSFCRLCGKSFKNTKWRDHFRVKHPEIMHRFPKTMTSIVEILNFQIDEAKKSGNILQYAKSRKVHNKWQCTRCQDIFRDNHHITQHLDSQHNSCSPPTARVLTKCYELKCGTFYPVPEHESQQTATATLTNPQSNQVQLLPSPPNYPIAQRATMTTPTNLQRNQAQLLPSLPSYTMAVIPSQSNMIANPLSQYIQYMGPLPSHITKGTTVVEDVLLKLIDKEDVIDGWIKIFYKYISTSENFMQHLKASLGCKQYNPDLVLVSNGPLLNLMKLYDTLEPQIRHIADGLPAHWKARLVKFVIQPDESTNIEGGATMWTFRYRSNSSPNLREMANLLCFLKARECPILGQFINVVSSPAYSHDEAARTGIISILLYTLAAECVPDGDYMPWVCQYALFRCFRLDRESNTPKLKSAATCGKIFATILYLLRQGILSCASQMQQSGHSDKVEGMIERVQKGQVINLLSPWIANCRAMTAKQAEKETSIVARNGDIICNKGVFRESIYTQLIPMVRGEVCTILDVMLQGDTWRLFLDKENVISVSEK